MIKEFIFKEGKIFPSCHASTLVELEDGDFLSCWFGGSKEGDKGKTWIKSKIPELDKKIFEGCTAPEDQRQEHGVIQPALWESSPGNVHMLLRSSCGRICRSDSNDCGVTWSKIYKTDMPNNNSGLDVVKLCDNSLALVCNPVPDNWGKRTPLSIFQSKDNGMSWKHCLDLEIADGEYSYPAIISTKKGLAITYTWNRTRIVFTKIESTKL